MACLAGHILCQDVLSLEEHFEVGLHIIERPLAALESGQEREQNIRVV